MEEPQGRVSSVLYSVDVPKVARITLNRPESRNSQDSNLLYDLNDAFNRAAQDDDVSVIVLAANGPHFSSGHHLGERNVNESLAARHTVGTWCGFECAGAEGMMSKEKEMYIGFSERWRNIPKPTIAEVQGKVIAGGLMLVWPCDIVVASDDAEFIDNTVAMGICGAEFFNHPWEVGVRMAKEMLFTSDALTASEAHRLGMVNHVVPRSQLTAFTMALAEKIALKPRFALRLVKEAVNAAQDNQGRLNAMQTSFALHQLSHSHNMQVHNMLMDPSFFETAHGAGFKDRRRG